MTKNTTEIVLDKNDQKEVDEVKEFLESLSETEKSVFRGFMYGVKFAKNGETFCYPLTQKQKGVII